MGADLCGRYENAECLVGVHRDQEVNSSKALTLDLRQVRRVGEGILFGVNVCLQYAE